MVKCGYCGCAVLRTSYDDRSYDKVHYTSLCRGCKSELPPSPLSYEPPVSAAVIVCRETLPWTPLRKVSKRDEDRRFAIRALRYRRMTLYPDVDEEEEMTQANKDWSIEHWVEVDHETYKPLPVHLGSNPEDDGESTVSTYTQDACQKMKLLYDATVYVETAEQSYEYAEQAQLSNYLGECETYEELEQSVDKVVDESDEVMDVSGVCKEDGGLSDESDEGWDMSHVFNEDDDQSDECDEQWDLPEEKEQDLSDESDDDNDLSDEFEEVAESEGNQEDDTTESGGLESFHTLGEEEHEMWCRICGQTMSEATLEVQKHYFKRYNNHRCKCCRSLFAISPQFFNRSTSRPAHCRLVPYRPKRTEPSERIMLLVKLHEQGSP